MLEERDRKTGVLSERWSIPFRQGRFIPTNLIPPGTLGAVQRIFRRGNRSLKRIFLGEPFSGYLARNPAFSEYNIGDWTQGCLRVRSLSKGKKLNLRIGRFCCFAEGSTILLGGERRVDWVTTFAFVKGEPFPGAFDRNGNVVIGNDVLVGEDALILSGITIGDGAVIGARSLVRRDVPPYAIVAGNPGRVAGFRFDKETIKDLLEIAWWDWPPERIEEAFPLLFSNDVAAFIKKYKKLSVAPTKNTTSSRDGSKPDPRRERISPDPVPNESGTAPSRMSSARTAS